jgi:hypothetical protein
MRLLGQVLETEATLADLQRRRERELRLQLRLRRALPPALAAHVRVADARSQELELVAASGAAAALLRQRAPDVLHKLAGEGWEFTGIRVRVQARPTGIAPAKTPKKQLDEAAATTLEALASRLGDDPLAKALRRLARRAPGRAGSGDDDQPLEGVKDQDAQQ